MRLLIIEDDDRLRTNIKTMLTSAAFAADTASTFQIGLHKAQDEDYDLIIMDWMLPDGDGPDLIKNLRHQKISTPILMLTAKTRLQDLVSGLDAGADDYLTKPFQMAELLARCRALTRRLPATTASILQIADLKIDTNTHQVQRQDQVIFLTPREYALLEYLARHPCQAISRQDLLSHAWDEQADPFSNTVDVHISYLRRKIDRRFTPRIIHTVTGLGYMLCEKLPSLHVSPS